MPMSIPFSMEDLRLHFITQDFLRRLEGRARDWDADFIARQIRAFADAHPQYPELVATLEGELDRRRLTHVMNEVRALSAPQLEQRLGLARADFAVGRISRDELEIVETWWRVKTGRKLREDYEPDQ